jgi:hypothetical protein
MKIADFKRDAENNVVAIDSNGVETIISFDYIEANKPRIGDEYPIILETLSTESTETLSTESTETPPIK